MTTTETVPGYTVDRVLGLVQAGSYWGFRPVRGKVTRQAAALGANAIVAMRYAGGRPSGFSGCVLYGTAVVVSPEAARRTQPRSTESWRAKAVR